MNARSNKKRFHWKVLVALFLALGIVSALVACGTTTPPAPASSPTATSAPTLTPIPKTPTASATEILALTPSPTPLPLFPLDRYVMLFIKDGDLYFQDGNNAPVQLTHGGETPVSPLISDDNKKIVFFRGKPSNDIYPNIYSVNTDGSQEHIVIPNDWLKSFKLGTKLGAVNFIPSTHQLFFETVLCQSQETDLPCPTSTFLADTDTGEISKLADLGRVLFNIDINSDLRNIKMSPNGKMLAVGTMEGMDIFTLDGKMIRNKILPYKPSTSTIVYPSLSWLPDSSGLIVALPDTTYYTEGHGDLPAHMIWRYTIASNAAVQIPLDPSPWMDTFGVSPDGTWIAYGGYSDPSLYLGNLVNGHTQIFGKDSSHPTFFWSPDSKKLIVGWRVVTSFDKPPVAIGSGSQWIDSNHFTYYDLPENNPAIQQERVLIAEIRGDEIYYYELGLPYPGLVTINPKQ